MKNIKNFELDMLTKICKHRYQLL